MNERKFQARIYKIWLMRHVDVPEEVSWALAAECAKRVGKSRQAETPKHIPVIATVNGRSQRTTLAPAGGGRYRLTLNAELRKAAQADAGDLIGVALRYDHDSRDLEAPPELRVALKEHPKAQKEFERLPPGHKRQLLLYYLRAKSPKAREYAAAWLIDHLVERAFLGKRSRPTKQKTGSGR